MTAPPLNSVKNLQPAVGAFAITPHNSNMLPAITRGIYVGPGASTVDLAVEMADGSSVTFVGIAQGVVHPIQARKVKATGTTATNIVGIV